MYVRVNMCIVDFYFVYLSFSSFISKHYKEGKYIMKFGYIKRVSDFLLPCISSGFNSEPVAF